MFDEGEKPVRAGFFCGNLWKRSALAGTAESARPPFTRGEVIHDVESDLHGRNHNQLSDTFHGIEYKDTRSAIPQRDENLALVVRIDQADQIAQDDAMFVTQSRSRQHDCGKSGISEMYRQT